MSASAGLRVPAVTKWQTQRLPREGEASIDLAGAEQRRAAAFDVASVLSARHGEAWALHEAYMNRQLARVLRTVGFNRNYVRGAGCYLFDDTGKRYLDFLSGFGVYALGRAHPGVKAALHQAIDLDLPNMVQLDCALLPGLLAEQLVSRCHPGISRVFFCNSGAEAVEAAVKFARHATGRAKLLHAGHAFHGLTTGALSLNGGKEFRDGFGPLLPGSVQVPFGDLAALDAQLRGGDVAAFIVEPVQGKTVECAPAEYWTQAQELCRRHGTLLVTDEVQTGLGRTGRFFCHEHWGLEPDIITVSKALSGGFVPVGAMLTSDRIFASVYRGMADAVKHSSTFGRNQLAMVAGLATLAALDDEDLVARAERTGQALRRGLAPLVERYELLREIRGLGLMVGLEFGEPERGSARRVFRAAERLRPGMFSQMIVLPLFHRHQILTQVAADNINVVKLLPPLIAGQEEVDSFVSALDDVLASAHRGHGFVQEFGLTMARGALRGSAGGRAAPPHGNGKTGTAAGLAVRTIEPPADPGLPATGTGLPATGTGQPGAVTGQPGAGNGHQPAGNGASPDRRPAPAAAGAFELEPGDTVAVTGASGFIGSAVARALRARGADVIALVQPGADDRNLNGLAARRELADIRDARAVKAAFAGARYIFHLAAVYRFWASDPRIFHEVNVAGTRNVLAAAQAGGCERLVYTSTVGVLGLAGTRDGGPADETSCADVGHLFGHYKQSKYVAEHEVLRAAAEGLDVSLVLPTFPLGPGDLTPTPTGKLVIDFLNGRMPAYTGTAMNVVHIDDLAAGHIAALERGTRGRSYILGGENLSMRTLLRVLSEDTGLPMPRLSVPRGLVLAAGLASDLIEGRLLRREPRVPLEAARMSATQMVFSDERARSELGYRSRPAREAILDSARWFASNGYVRPDRRAMIHLPEGRPGDTP
jgi:ornithine--oxo-acid transaminase